MRSECMSQGDEDIKYIVGKVLSLVEKLHEMTLDDDIDYEVSRDAGKVWNLLMREKDLKTLRTAQRFLIGWEASRMKI